MRKAIMSPKLVLSILGIFSIFGLNAQVGNFPLRISGVEFERIGEEQGVPKVSRCIYNDSRGFVWFGTDIGGLYRYDGYEFELYQYIYDDSTSLSSNWIYSILHEDPSGDLWINAGGQLNRYNRSSDNFTRFVCNPDDPYSIINGMITSVSSDTEGNIWIGSFDSSVDRTTGGLCMYNRETGLFTRYINGPGKKEGVSSNHITCLHADDSGSVWAGTLHNGVDRLIPGGNEKGYSIINYKYLPDSTGREECNIISSIAEDGEGYTWFGTGGGGLLKYDKVNDNITRYWVHPVHSSPGNNINLLSVDPIGQLWLGTGDGLGKYDRAMDSVILFRNDPANPSSITPGVVVSLAHNRYGLSWVITNNKTLKPSEGICRFDPVTGIFENFRANRGVEGGLQTDLIHAAIVDNSGILWIATTDGGINRFDPRKRKFNLYECNPNSTDGMPPGKIYSGLVDYKGILWIGTYENGLFRLDRQTGNITKFTVETDNLKGINNNTVMSICEGLPGTLWLGGLGGLNKLNTETMEFECFVHDPGNPNSIGSNHIMSIYRDIRDILWIGTIGGGLSRFDPETEEFKSINLDINGQGSIYSDWVFSVSGNLKGTIWLGTPSGLVKFVPGDNGSPDRYVHYRHEMNNPNSLSYDIVRMVTEDKLGNLWIATEGGGLNRLNTEDETFTIYTVEDGLPSNVIEGILTDENNRVWISTINGISEFNPGTGIFHNYDRSDGLQANEFTFGAYFESSTGEMFFGGEKGLNYFYPDSIVANPNIPPVVITGFQLHNKPVATGANSPLEKSIGETMELSLKHDENFITFEFAALNYTNTHKNQYKYRMIGLDADTVYAGTRRFADFPGMKPGRYTFWVTGSNNDGFWNENGTSIKIIIRPPWWRSKLAYGIYLFLVLLGFTGFVRWRTWSLRREKEVLEKLVGERTLEVEMKDLHILEMDRMKTRFFTNVSHEFRTLITLILSPIEAVIAKQTREGKDNNELGLARMNALRLTDLVNQLLDLSKIDSGKMKLQLVNEDIIKALGIALSSYDSLAKRKGILYNFEKPGYEFYTWFDRGKIETIVNNLLSNAFKYTPPGGKIDCRVNITGAGKEEELREMVEICIDDSGPGIAEDKLDLIFDRFYQADEQHSGDGVGTGIGLSVTKELVQLLHGEIRVSSNQGVGTLFSVIIPVGRDHLKESEFDILTAAHKHVNLPAEEILPDDLPLVIKESDYSPGKRTVQVLVVEDNSDLRTFLKEQLQEDYLVIEAHDGKEGLTSALRTVPDLIISDIMMPGMDGVEFCYKIKTNERTSHIPVVLLTAMADMDNRIKGLENGADDYITKPFDINELKVRVRNMIEQRRMLRERFSGNLNVAGKEISFNSYDMQFINRIVSVTEDHMGDLDFDVNNLQEKAGLSHSQLYRKLFALTGLSPSKFICVIRMKRAVTLMEQGYDNVTRLSLEVGFNNLSYFSKCFREIYGVSPSVYLKQVKEVIGNK